MAVCVPHRQIVFTSPNFGIQFQREMDSFGYRPQVQVFAISFSSHAAGLVGIGDHLMAVDGRPIAYVVHRWDVLAECVIGDPPHLGARHAFCGMPPCIPVFSDVCHPRPVPPPYPSNPRTITTSQHDALSRGCSPGSRRIHTRIHGKSTATAVPVRVSGTCGDSGPHAP